MTEKNLNSLNKKELIAKYLEIQDINLKLLENYNGVYSRLEKLSSRLEVLESSSLRLSAMI